MSDRIAHFTTSLRRQTRLLRLGPAPALIARPEEPAGPTPLVLWLHGRTVSKEIDSARYLTLIRAGIAVCAIDLPGHGEREDPALQAPEALSELLSAARAELDEVVEALLAAVAAGPEQVDPERLAIGGMSAGGMISLRRLCDPHPFSAVAVESTAGDFSAAARTPQDRWMVARLQGLDPAQHLDGWRPLPLLALHSEADQVTPVAGIRAFTEALARRYAALGAPAEWVELRTWPETGAPMEHAGFGRRSREARQVLAAFFTSHLVDTLGSKRD